MGTSGEVPSVTLNDGAEIPQVGLGVWQASEEEAARAVRDALAAGYRHVDTAAAYDNERGVGRGVADSGVPRAEIFLTSKVWNADIRAGETRAALERSLERLGTDHVDLMLLHWPAEGRLAAWQALIEAREAGLARSIGVSNFLPEHLDELIAETSVVPALNQIEHHPLLTQPAIREACERHGIAVEAWSPLMQGRFGEEPALGEIAAALDRSEAQVVLRWALQRGVVVIPKSVNRERIEENVALFDFELDAAAMRRIDALDRGERLGPDPATFDF